MSLLPDPISSGLSSAKFIIIAVITLIIIGVFGYEMYTKSQLQTQLAQAQTDIVALTAANENWKTASDQQNAAIAAEATAEKQRADAAAVAVATAQKTSDQNTKDAADIMAVKPPSAPAPDAPLVIADPQCAAAEKLMNSYFGIKK